MTLSLQDWHNRFMIQAQWTKKLRLYFFNLLKSTPAERILDIGCGTGALLQDLQKISPGKIMGADIQPDSLSIAHQLSPDSFLTGADVHHLPYPDNSFDIVLNHYFLMWIGDPVRALKEMKRVTRPQGFMVSFAEPDYGGRLDHPAEFNNLREHQISGLIKAGADPRMGRKLKSLFHSIGLEDVQSGVYEGSWVEPSPKQYLESEWKMTSNDLQGILSTAEINELKKHDLAARESGSRLIYVPTFYAWGRVHK
jgi:ubiquinone/menaquinone biosynthesis C-methylase UbiE